LLFLFSGLLFHRRPPVAKLAAFTICIAWGKPPLLLLLLLLTASGFSLQLTGIGSCQHLLHCSAAVTLSAGVQQVTPWKKGRMPAER
jgi:hypothetical protein